GLCLNAQLPRAAVTHYYSSLCLRLSPSIISFFFFTDTATTEIYTLSLHDALPISQRAGAFFEFTERVAVVIGPYVFGPLPQADRSEEHTSELQSQSNLVCRLLLEKKKKK